MKNILMFATLLLAVSTQAQTVTPIHSEAKVKPGRVYKGEFFVMNDTITSMPVVVEPREVKGGPDGKPLFMPLSDDIHVELSETSAVVPPKGEHQFEFKITCLKNCAVSMFAGMTTGKAVGNSVQIRMWMPSTQFLCVDTAKDCRTRLKQSLGITE